MIWFFDLIWIHILCDIDLMYRFMRKSMLCVSNKQNSLRKKIARQLYSDFFIIKTVNLRLCIQLWIYSFYSARDAQVNSYCVFVLFFALHRSCSALHWWNSIQQCFDLLSRSWFLCIRDAHDCNVETVFLCLMIVIHSTEKYMWKRDVYDEKIKCDCK